MNLLQVMQKLSYGPLSELAIGGTGSGSIPTEHVPKLVHHTGNALVALYARFPLRIKTVDLELVDGIYEYALKKQFAQTSGSTEINKYIKDSIADQFVGDVLKICGITNLQTQEDVPLNQRRNDLSWHTVSYDTLRMNYPVGGESYQIEYRARHAELPTHPSEEEQETIDIKIPPELEASLLAHIASNVYGSMSMEGSMIKSQGFLATYEGEVAQHETSNTWDQHHTATNDGFCRGGWV